jgi:hypothetical protein
VSSFGTRVELVGGHAHVRVYVGPKLGARAGTGVLIMSPHEANEFVARVADGDELKAEGGEPDAEMGERTRHAVAFFLQQLNQITGKRGQEELVLLGLVAICGFSKASGHDLPGVVKRLLETLSRRNRKEAP